VLDSIFILQNAAIKLMLKLRACFWSGYLFTVFSAPVYALPISPDPVIPKVATTMFAGTIPLRQELTVLKAEMQRSIANYPDLYPGVFVMDLETGDYVDIASNVVFPAASTIKLPILLAFFEAVDLGKIDLNETLTVERELIASGSGTLQYSPGKELTALETATKMIIISDNTATNMIIERLGGIEFLNYRFRAWGLQNTYLRNMLGDFQGTNKTTPADLVRVAALIAKHKVIGEKSRVEALDILNATENRKLLAAGLGEGAHIAHKTGDIGFAIGDAGIVERPNGKLYLIGVFVMRPYNDIKARYLVQELSRSAYNYLVQQ
jgi:beta-lactamase class A